MGTPRTVFDDDELHFLLNTEGSELYARYPGIPKNTVRAKKRSARRQAGTQGAAQGPSQEVGQPASGAAPKEWEAGVQITGDRGWLCSGPTDKPITDWSRVMEIWNLDPREFEIVGHVTFKAWNGFIKNAKFEIETVRLYSYKANIQRVTNAEVLADRIDWESWRLSLRLMAPFVPSHRDENKRAYVVCVADPQIGKKGTAQALDNWLAGIEYHKRQILEGSFSSVVLAFMGDEHEGVANNYANQPHTVELNLSEQLLTDFDMRVFTVRELQSVGLSDVVSVISNHGEHTRNGSKDAVTGREDNSSTMITRMVQRLFEGDDIDWHIASGNPTVLLSIAGVSLAFSHGHVAKGAGKGEMRVRTAIERQILGSPEVMGSVDVHFTAHYHHFHSVTDRGRTIFGCPALEAEKSSEYMLDQYGIWSRPGMLGVQVGASCGASKWSNADVWWAGA